MQMKNPSVSVCHNIMAQQKKNRWLADYLVGIMAIR